MHFYAAVRGMVLLIAPSVCLASTGKLTTDMLWLIAVAVVCCDVPVPAGASVAPLTAGLVCTLVLAALALARLVPVSTAGQKSHARQRQRWQCATANLALQKEAHWAVGTSALKSETQSDSGSSLEFPGGAGQ